MESVWKLRFNGYVFTSWYGSTHLSNYAFLNYLFSFTPNFILNLTCYLIFLASGSFLEGSSLWLSVPCPLTSNSGSLLGFQIIFCHLNHMHLDVTLPLSQNFTCYVALLSLPPPTHWRGFTQHIKPGITREMTQHLSDWVILGITWDYKGKFVLVLSKEITFYILRTLYLHLLHVLWLEYRFILKIRNIPEQMPYQS